MSTSLVPIFLEPERTVRRWACEGPTPPLAWPLLGATAALGMGTWCAMLHAWRGADHALVAGLHGVLATGIGWCAAIPSLVVLGGLFGSKLQPRAPVLASLVAVAWGGLALLCAVPILWFFEITTGGEPWARALAVGATGLGVGICITSVFLRSMRVLDTGRSFFYFVWVGLLGSTCAEMIVLFDLLRLT